MITAIPKELAQNPWIKVVGMLQQNWAVIVKQQDSATAVFYNDLCEVFDEIRFDSADEASEALLRNGFSKYHQDPKFSEFIAVPEGEFTEGSHPNGPIYSSGKHWR